MHSNSSSLCRSDEEHLLFAPVVLALSGGDPSRLEWSDADPPPGHERSMRRSGCESCSAFLPRGCALSLRSHPSAASEINKKN